MINQIIPIVFALYFAAEWNHYTYTIIWASVLTNFVFSVTVLKEACRSSTFQKIITGEVTAIMKYCLFLNLHQPKILLYYLPLLLSSSGKIYLLIEEKSKV